MSTHDLYSILPELFSVITRKLGLGEDRNANVYILSLSFVCRRFNALLSETIFGSSPAYNTLCLDIIREMERGNMSILPWCMDLFPSRIRLVVPLGLVTAARKGDLSTIQSLQHEILDPCLAGEALGEFLQERSRDPYNLPQTPFTSFFLDSIVDEASLNGHLHILQWVKTSCRLYDPYYFYNAAISAARGGHMHILQWLRQNVQVCKRDQELLTASLYGPMTPSQVEVIRWAIRNTVYSNWTVPENTSLTRFDFRLHVTGDFLRGLLESLTPRGYVTENGKHCGLKGCSVGCGSPLYIDTSSDGRQALMVERFVFILSAVKECEVGTNYSHELLESVVTTNGDPVSISRMAGVLYPDPEGVDEEDLEYDVKQGHYDMSPPNLAIACDVLLSRITGARLPLHPAVASRNANLVMSVVLDRELFSPYRREKDFLGLYLMFKTLSAKTCISFLERAVPEWDPDNHLLYFPPRNEGDIQTTLYGIDMLTRRERKELDCIVSSDAPITGLLAIATSRDTDELFKRVVTTYRDKLLPWHISHSLVVHVIEYGTKSMLECLYEHQQLGVWNVAYWSHMISFCPPTPEGSLIAHWLRERQEETEKL